MSVDRVELTEEYVQNCTYEFCEFNDNTCLVCWSIHDDKTSIYTRFNELRKFAQEDIKVNPNRAEELEKWYKQKMMELCVAGGLTDDDLKYYRESMSIFGRPALQCPNGGILTFARGELVDIVYYRGLSDEDLEKEYKSYIVGLEYGVSLADVQNLHFIEREMSLRESFNKDEKVEELSLWNKKNDEDRQKHENYEWGYALLNDPENEIIDHWACDCNIDGEIESNGGIQYIVKTSAGEYYSVIGGHDGERPTPSYVEPQKMNPDDLPSHIVDEGNSSKDTGGE